MGFSFLARCKDLPRPPKHGLVIVAKSDHGMKGRYKCKDGYVLYGKNVTECRYGNWTSRTPKCKQSRYLQTLFGR